MENAWFKVFSPNQDQIIRHHFSNSVEILTGDMFISCDNFMILAQRNSEKIKFEKCTLNSASQYIYKTYFIRDSQSKLKSKAMSKPAGKKHKIWF